jgi:hypothetical protein
MTGGEETGGGKDSGGTRTEQGGSPEEQPGGAGDEEPARSQALFTGRAGRITPRVVRVPAFFSVRVVLRSADGQTYGLRIGGRTLRAGGTLGSSSITLDALRTGRAYEGTELDTGVAVRVEATAEPGP